MMSGNDCLSPLAVAAILLLAEGDMHPYEMMRTMRRRQDDRLFAITNGTFYHTIRRLERAGYIAEVGIDREGNRPERTTYTLTPTGRADALDWIRRELTQVDRESEFRVALAECHNLPRDEVLRLLTARRHRLAAVHALYHDSLATAYATDVPRRYLIEVDRQATLLSADLEWLDSFIARLTSRKLPWDADTSPIDPLAQDLTYGEAAHS